MDASKYTYRVMWSEEDKEFVGLCSEFPSLSWLSKSQSAALAGIRRVVKDVLRDLKKSKATIPAPLSLQDFSGKFVVRVPPEIHRKLTMEAAEAGVSLNRVVSQKLAS